jgi:hypothetical protein
MRRLLPITWLVLACIVQAVCSGPAAAQGADARQKLQSALAWLQRTEPSMDAASRKQAPALRAILERYYLDDASITACEADIAEAFLKTMPDESGANLQTRDPAGALKELQAALHKAPGVAERPTFYSGTRRTPGGKSIGYIDVSMQGRRRTVVELLSAPAKTTLIGRAKVIARDMQNVQQRQPLWWTQLSVGRIGSEYVVRAPGAPRGYLITADKHFAREWGLSRPSLAKQLITTIRRTFDPAKGTRIAMRDATPTPDEVRSDAVELRQAGDDAYARDPAEAEAKYRAAIETDPAYAVPYLRLADLLASAHRSADAKSILRQALAVTQIPADQRADLRKRLAQLK